MPDRQATPPGWYDDGSGARRWFDGNAWTPYVLPPVPPLLVPVAVDVMEVGEHRVEPPSAQLNGLGLAALLLSAAGVLFGLVRFTFFVAGALGLVGLVLGVVGWRRAARGAATNKAVAVAGTTLSAVALVLATLGLVVAVAPADEAGSELRAIDRSGSAVSASCSGLSYPDQQRSDICADGTSSVLLDGVSVKATPLERRGADGVTAVCSDITVANTASDTKSVDVLDYTLRLPTGEVRPVAFSAQSTLESGDLAAAVAKTGSVCFADVTAAGPHLLVYKPDALESARGIWITML